MIFDRGRRWFQEHERDRAFASARRKGFRVWEITLLVCTGPGTGVRTSDRPKGRFYVAEKLTARMARFVSETKIAAVELEE